jgi:SAM-dependent methyltransferase
MSTPYIYQPATGSLSHAEAVQWFREQGFDLVEGGIDNTSPAQVERILATAEQCGWSWTPLDVNSADYADYYQQAEYDGRYPGYYIGNRHEKTLEHFLCIQLLQIQPQDVFVDLASEHSPLPEIVGRLMGCASYSQDIMYPEGIHGRQIGGDACAMPVPAGFATKAALTCSIEHFEGDADHRLFVELARVLAPGGKVCVVPFYLYHEPAVQTDPTYSAVHAVPFDPGARLFAAEGWGNRHGRFYSPRSFMERIAEPVAEAFTFDYFWIRNASELHPGNYVRFALVATRR